VAGGSVGGDVAPAGEVWPHTLLCGRRRRLRQLRNPGITGDGGWRTKKRREKYKGGGLHRSKGLPRAVRRGCGEKARPEGDLKLKLPRFRLDEFISLAKENRLRHSPNDWKLSSLNKMEIFRFRNVDFLHSLILLEIRNLKIISLWNLLTLSFFFKFRF